MDAQQPKGPLPVPHPWPFSHLPTPQRSVPIHTFLPRIFKASALICEHSSPNNLARYVGDHTPQSPLHDLYVIPNLSPNTLSIPPLLRQQPSDEAIISSSYQRPTASSRLDAQTLCQGLLINPPRSAEETPTKSNGSRQCMTPESRSVPRSIYLESDVQN